MQTFRFRFPFRQKNNDNNTKCTTENDFLPLVAYETFNCIDESQLHRPCFPNTDHMTIPTRFQPSSCSLKRLHASTKISNVERKYCAGYRHMICIGKTKSWTSEKGLLSEFVFKIKNGLRANFALKLNSF